MTFMDNLTRELLSMTFMDNLKPGCKNDVA